MRVADTQFTRKLLRENFRTVKKLYLNPSNSQLSLLRELSRSLHLSLPSGDLIMLGGTWYVTHSGLLRVAQRSRCKGITTELADCASSPKEGRWVFKATVVKSGKEQFVGYGDANPSNVSFLVRGAEMRVAETRAVNRALRKAYGIGICSVEELGSLPGPVQANCATRARKQAVKVPAQPVNGNGNGGHGSNGNGSRVRDRLCQLIRQHELNAELVKCYAVDFCGTKALREATREQVENFVAHLADWAEKDRNALLGQLNSYSRPQAGAA
jgi:hypothetical protein